jgi:diaminopimelate epimerase
MTDGGWPFLKGHGTGNDFVLLPDPHGELDLTPALVRALCDRHRGIGADGVIRLVPTASAAEVAGQAGRAPWFMDYRNADGSLAEMCGNGVRVVARYLVEAGLQAPGEFWLATRAGVKTVVAPDFADGTGSVTVDMGAARFPADEGLTVFPSEWAAGQVPRSPAGLTGGSAAPAAGLPAVSVDMGNPHAVAFVDTLDAAGRLIDPPVVNPPGAFPDGVNVEFATMSGLGDVAMRVYERGVGETLSCGTGVCAVFAAARRRAGEAGATTRDWVVHVPGGSLLLSEDAAGGIHMTGPAEFVVSGTISATWLDRNR